MEFSMRVVHLRRRIMVKIVSCRGSSSRGARGGADSPSSSAATAAAAGDSTGVSAREAAGVGGSIGAAGVSTVAVVEEQRAWRRWSGVGARGLRERSGRMEMRRWRRAMAAGGLEWWRRETRVYGCAEWSQVWKEWPQLADGGLG
jgi:hypothetical protein